MTAAQPDSCCVQCGQPIMGKQWMAPTGQAGIWHSDCFQCWSCNKKLTHGDYGVHKGMPMCKACLKKETVVTESKKCIQCSKPIADKPVFVKDGYYHRDCFTCSVCKCKLTISNWYDKESKIYCKMCYYKTYPHKCCQCDKMLMGSVKALLTGSTYCDACFSCYNCKAGIATNFFELKGALYCANCEMQYRNDKYMLAKSGVGGDVNPAIN